MRKRSGGIGEDTAMLAVRLVYLVRADVHGHSGTPPAVADVED